MTIKELIKILSQYDPETRVVVSGYEGGYNDLLEVEPLSIKLNVNTKWYYGAHDTADERSEPIPNVPFTSVVYLRGYNHIAEEDWHGY
ncbi:MAG: hypothetical protein RLZZ148_2378 [Cyanobacteriota bacterium]